MIEVVCSGFQTGADIGGILAAYKHGIKTTGWMPKGFKTEEGPRPEYAALYGAKEHPSPEYPPRTEANVRDSDTTIWLGAGDSRGYWCTRKAVERLGKGWIEVGTGWVLDIKLPSEAAEIIRETGVVVLNVAGNRASSSPGIEERVFRFLCRVFRLLKEDR